MRFSIQFYRKRIYIKILRNILTYNEVVDFVNDPENKGFINLTPEPYQTKQFTILGKDFAHPEDEEAFKHMLPKQFFQVAEGISDEEWEEKTCLRVISPVKADLDKIGGFLHGYFPHVDILLFPEIFTILEGKS